MVRVLPKVPNGETDRRQLRFFRVEAASAASNGDLPSATSREALKAAADVVMHPAGREARVRELGEVQKAATGRTPVREELRLQPN